MRGKRLAADKEPHICTFSTPEEFAEVLRPVGRRNLDEGITGGEPSSLRAGLTQDDDVAPNREAVVVPEAIRLLQLHERSSRD